MLKAAFVEYFTRLRETLRWWKVIVFILLSLFMVFGFRETVSLSIWKIYIPLWTGFLVKPKENKINFILPIDEKSRYYYLLGSAFSVTIFFTVWYVLIHAINVIFHAYEIRFALKAFLCFDFPFILIASPGTVFNGYMDNTNDKSKQNAFKTGTLILLLMFPTVHLALLYHFLAGGWLYISTILSYLCVLSAVRLLLDGIKCAKLNYENIKKTVKWWA